MPEDEFYEDSVQTMEDFIRYVHELRKDLKTNPEDFENNTLPLFLEAIADYTEHGLRGRYYFFKEHFDPEKPSWNMFARILAGASVFE